MENGSSNITPDEAFFLTESVKISRTLSFTDSLRYLRGLVIACGDHPATNEIREHIQALTASDQQLQLWSERTNPSSK